MKFRISPAVLPLFFAVFSTLLPAFAPISSSPVRNLHWLIGTWKGGSEGNEYLESWAWQKGGALVGRAELKNSSGEVLVSEILKIETFGDHTIYLASVNRRRPVLFTLVESKQEQWVFENKEHDFPQRIVYKRESRNRLLARVEGVSDGKEIREEFRLTRLKGKGIAVKREPRDKE